MVGGWLQAQLDLGVCLVLSRLYGRKVGVIVNGFDLKRIPKLRESAIV